MRRQGLTSPSTPGGWRPATGALLPELWGQGPFPQGDPLGPLLSDLLLQAVAQQLQEVEGLNLNAWYLDHGTLVGPREALQEAWDLLVAQS